MTAWIERGDWSRKISKEATERRAEPVAEYSARKLTQWQKKLLKKSRELGELGPKKRHRLRLKNKRLSYAIEAAASLVPDSETQAHQATLKLSAQGPEVARPVERRCEAPIACRALGEDKTGASDLLLKPKQKKLLLRKATEAYGELAELRACCNDYLEAL